MICLTVYFIISLYIIIILYNTTVELSHFYLQKQNSNFASKGFTSCLSNVLHFKVIGTDVYCKLQHWYSIWNPSIITKVTSQKRRGQKCRRSSWQLCQKAYVTLKMSEDNVRSTGPVQGRSAALLPSWEAWTFPGRPEQEACIDQITGNTGGWKCHNAPPLTVWAVSTKMSSWNTLTGCP